MKKKLLVALKSLAMRLIIAQILIIVSALTSYAKDARGQEALNQKISVNVTHTELNAVLEKVQNKVGAKFVFSPTIINVKRKLSFSIQDKTVADFLKEIVEPLGISYKAVGNLIILYDERDKDDANKISAIDDLVTAEKKSTDRDLSGIILNEKKEPVAGASIMIQGTKTGTLTDTNGRFHLSIPDNKSVTLLISSVGYQNQTIEVNSNTSSINVTLNTNVGNLNEVVVIGYGTQRKGDITSSVSSVKAENFIKGSVKDAGQLIKVKLRV